MAYPADLATITHDTPQTAPPPATLQQWRPYIPEHIDPTASPAPGGHCACPTVAGIVLHIAECAQGVSGRAQPYGPATCAEYNLELNTLIDPLTLAAALRGITVGGLPLVMELESEDRALDVHAAKSAYEAGVAEGESEAEALFETLRKRLPVEQYDAVLDGLDMNDPDAVLTRLRAEVSALPAPFTVPPAPGAAPVRAEAPALDAAGSAENPGPDAPVPATTNAKSSWRVECQELEDELFTMTPGLRHVAASADALGAGRQGVLAVTLTRTSVAVGPHVRLLTASGMRGTARQGGSLNFYSALVGKPNAGKTEAADAGAYLVPLSDDDLIPEGTGEGIVKSFGFMRREKHGRGDDAFYTYEFEKMAERVLMAADEVDAVFAEMVRQGTKFASTWRSMWMGAMVGTTTGNVELRTKLRPHTYRLGVLLGCQPEATVALWEEGNRGTPQRIHWAPCTRRKPNGKEVPEPLKLAYQPVQRVGLPDDFDPTNYGEELEPRWIEWPPAARRFIEAELEALQEDDDPYGEGDDDEEDEILTLLGHSTFMRLKIMALLAIMDGLEQPTDAHWKAAGIVMRLREMCMRRTKARATRAGKVAAENRGAEQGITRAAAKRGEAEAEAEFSRDLQLRIIVVIKQLRGRHESATAAAIGRLCSKKQAPHVKRHLAAMVESEALTVTADGTYAVN